MRRATGFRKHGEVIKHKDDVKLVLAAFTLYMSKVKGQWTLRVNEVIKTISYNVVNH